MRGEETVERVRASHLVEDRIGKVETLYGDAVSRAEDVLERVNGLLGRPGRAAADTEEDSVVEAEVVEVTTESTPGPAANGAPKKTPAKKAPAAKKAPPKKAAPKND